VEGTPKVFRMMQTQGPKSQIIEVLSQEFPLTARKLYNALRKRCMTSATYHAMYQHVQELVGQGVIVKDGVEYRLDGKWINNTLEIAQRTEIKYSRTCGNNVLRIPDDIQNVRLLTFDSMKQFHQFIAEYKRQFVESAAEGSEIYWLTNHIWWTLLYMYDYTDMTSKAMGKKMDYHLAIRGNKPLDKAVENFYKNMGVKGVKIGVNNADSSVIGIYNDTMFMIVYPEDLLRSIDEFFLKTDSTDNMKVMNFFNSIMNSENKIFMVMIKNKYFVDSQKKLIKSLF